MRWHLTQHARQRAAEFGYALVDVLLAAAMPDVAYDQPHYVGRVHQRGHIAVAVIPERMLIKTVLKRQVERWEHDG